MEAAPHIHWADTTARQIIDRRGDKDLYVLAAGITPSGTVHFGNFREVITADFVARALRDRGKKVRFIFSWDDFDTFRKIPDNMPKREELEKFLHKPIVDTPDPHGEADSYAAFHERSFEHQLAKLAVEPEPIYQARQYRSGRYAPSIRLALEKRKEIASILNKHRREPYGDDYLPVGLYCGCCGTDRDIAEKSWDGQAVGYRCGHCGHQGRESPEGRNIKLPWRIDWPMRWAFEGVDFEPGGKDHSSEGGSYTTASEIVELFGKKPPIYLRYDFVALKGLGGKMSSSSGNLVTVADVLNVYEPEMVRWIFAGYKPNVDFSVAFDLDVIKTYENYDRQERIAYGIEEGGKKAPLIRRIFELSQIGPMPEVMPFQPSFRHLTNVLQINGGDLDKTKRHYGASIKSGRDERRFQERARCALHWLEYHAPEDFKFRINNRSIRTGFGGAVDGFLDEIERCLRLRWDEFETDKQLHEGIYETIGKFHLEPKEAFRTLYRILISQDKGPKLASFMRTIGKDKVLALLRRKGT